MVRSIIHFIVFVGLIGLQIGVSITYKLSQSVSQSINYYAYNPSAVFAIAEFIKLLFSLSLIFWSAYQSVNQSGYQGKSTVLYTHVDSDLDVDAPEDSPLSRANDQSLCFSPSETDTDIEAPIVRKLTDHQSNNQSNNASNSFSDSSGLLSPVNKHPHVTSINNPANQSKSNAFFALLHQIFRHELSRSPVNQSLNPSTIQTSNPSALRTLFSLFVLALLVQSVNQLTFYLILIVSPATILLFKSMSQSIYQIINPSFNQTVFPFESKVSSSNQNHTLALALQVLGLALAQHQLFNQSADQIINHSSDQLTNQMTIYLMLGGLTVLTAFQSIMTEKNQKQTSSNQWLNQSISHTVNQHCYQSINQTSLSNHVQNVMLHTFGALISLSAYLLAPSINPSGEQISFFDGIIYQSIDQSINYAALVAILINCLIGVFLFVVFKMFQPSPQLSQSINQSNYQSINHSKMLASLSAVVTLLIFEQRILAAVVHSSAFSMINVIGVAVLFIGMFLYSSESIAPSSHQSTNQLDLSSNGLSLRLNGQSINYTEYQSSSQPAQRSSVIPMFLTVVIVGAVSGILLTQPIDQTVSSLNQSPSQQIVDRSQPLAPIKCDQSTSHPLDPLTNPSINPNPKSAKRGRIAVVYSGAPRAFSAVFQSHIINLFAPSPFAIDLFMHLNVQSINQYQTKYLRSHKNYAPIHPDHSAAQSVNRTAAEYEQQLRNWEMFYQINQSPDQSVIPEANHYPSVLTVNATLDYMRYYRDIDNELVDIHQLIKYYEVDNTNDPSINLSIDPGNNKTYPFSKPYEPIFHYLTDQSGSRLDSALSALSSLARASEAMTRYAKEHGIEYDMIVRVRYDYMIKNNIWLHVFDVKVRDQSIGQIITPSINRTLELDDLAQGKMDTLPDQQSEQAIKQNLTDLSIDLSIDLSEEQSINQSIEPVDDSSTPWSIFSAQSRTYHLYDMLYTSRLSPGTWYVPHCEHFGGSNDQFLLSSPHVYDIYSHRGRNLTMLEHLKAVHVAQSNSKWLFQVERFVKSVAEIHDIKVRGLPMCYGVMRMAQLNQFLGTSDQSISHPSHNLYVYTPTRCSFRGFGANSHELGEECCRQHCVQIQHMQNRLYQEIKQTVERANLKNLLSGYGSQQTIVMTNNQTIKQSINQLILPNVTSPTSITLHTYLSSFSTLEPSLHLSNQQSSYYYYYTYGSPRVAVGCSPQRWDDPIDPYSIHVKARKHLMPFLIFDDNKRAEYQLTKTCAKQE